MRTHTAVRSEQTHSHTRSSGQPFLCCGARGAVGGSVPCSRTPQLWYWGWRERWTFTPPTHNSYRTWDSAPQPSAYKSNSLTIRPRLPPMRVILKIILSLPSFRMGVGGCFFFVCFLTVQKMSNKAHPSIIKIGPLVCVRSCIQGAWLWMESFWTWRVDRMRLDKMTKVKTW